MDRERLKEVHQSDLTEGRINQDFVDWLQTKGMSWLLVLLIGICAYSAMVYYKRHRANYQGEAWAELAKATLPSSFEDVAEKYSDVGAIPQLARLRAANELLVAVQTGQMLGAETDGKKDLTDKDRDDYLSRADGLYEKIVAADDQSIAKTLMTVTALTGRAAVAESMGKLDQAKEFYGRAAARAETSYPKLAQQAKVRAEQVDLSAHDVKLPAAADLASAATQPASNPTFDPITVEPWMQEILNSSSDKVDE